MSYTTTTSYGTWCNQVNQYSTSPDSDVLDYINGGDNAWQELLEKSGALDDIQTAYRAKINDALPPSVSLCGDEFIGPAHPDDDEFEDYPTDKHGTFDIAACVEGIDLAPIVEYYDPLTLEDIGRNCMRSTAKEPAKAASKAMSRLGVKPFHYGPNPSGRPQAYFRSGEVRDALDSRPGKGNRTPREDLSSR
ncbi:hypothetical protein [Streptomyces halstedii]|uniref:hypothetical protein n=1 Tax=Streptomyces halstedii TaxID=1944 RepID=UPI003804C349